VFTVCLLTGQQKLASPGGPKQKTLAFKEGNICIGPSLTVSIIIREKITYLLLLQCMCIFFFSFSLDVNITDG